MATDNDATEIFADSILTVTLANGVFRLVLAQQDEGNQAKAVGKLLVPATQLPAMIQGLANAVNTLVAQGRKQADEAEAAAESDQPEPKGEMPAEDGQGRGKRKK
jgi:hypothetical protein